jgi:cytochrome c-type biogenesis protein
MVLGVEIILTSFILGLAAAFAPCLFPVLPAFVAYLTNADQKKVNGLIASTLVILGIMTAFLSFSFILITFTNIAFLNFLDSNYVLFRTIQSIILILMGILLIIGIKFQFAFLDELSTKAQFVINKFDNYMIQSYLIGLFFAVLAAPCALVIFGALINLLFISPTILSVTIINVMFALGAGMPFFIMAVILPLFKSEIAKNENTNKKFISYIPIITGAILILLGILMGTGALDIIAYQN